MSTVPPSTREYKGFFAREYKGDKPKSDESYAKWKALADRERSTIASMEGKSALHVSDLWLEYYEAQAELAAAREAKAAEDPPPAEVVETPSSWLLGQCFARILAYFR